ncbi:MAG TPA: DUF3037 domain-containing protein [Ktedonobacterales bacterium]
MPARSSFDYAIVRVVPRVERGECMNVGVMLFSRTRRYLAARIELDVPRLLAFAPEAERDLAAIQHQLDTIPLICAGGAAAGPIGLLSQAERWHWLVAPTSTIIQPSPVHSGLCTDPESMLDHLLTTMVRSPSI